MKTFRVTCIAVAVLLSCAASAAAQQPKPEERVAVFGVGGLVVQQVLRDGQLSVTGPTFGIQMRTAHQGPAGFVVEINVQPTPAKDRHPLISDPLAPFYLLGGVEIGRGTYIRLSAGLTTLAAVAPMAGFAAGFESRGSGVVTGLEFVVRVGGTPKAFGIMAGFQARIGGHPDSK